jgi:environmental stress-induced protein Ves
MWHETRRKRDCPVSVWAGGRTTELFIYPRSAKLADRDFDIRVSSATVELDESEFSRFPGYVRHITPLAGEMKLVHSARYVATLRAPSVDIFDGSWTTRSFGRCTDFNLIHKPEWTGRIGALSTSELTLAPSGFTVVYAKSAGTVIDVKNGGEKFAVHLDGCDMLLIETSPDDSCLVSFRGEKSPNAAPPVFATAAKR